MKKSILLIFLVMIMAGGKLFADNEGYHDPQQITSYEYYQYVTSQTGNNHHDDGDSGGNKGGNNGGNKGGNETPNNNNSGGPSGKYAELQRVYTTLLEELSNIRLGRNTGRTVEDVKADLDKVFADIKKAAREIAEMQKTCQTANKDEKAENNTATPGDPVKASVGAYIQEETDISTRLLTIKRKYESDDTIVSCLGRGWTFSLDQRIILGIEPLAEMKYETLLQEAEKLKKSETEYKSKILSDFEVSSLESGADEITARLEKCNSIENDINNLANEGSSYVDVTSLRNEAAAKKAAVENDLHKFRESLQSLENLKNEYERLFQEAEEYKNTVIKKNNERKNRNKKVMFPGSPSYYEETGLDTITFIDEDGYPHILYEREDEVWENEEDKSIAECSVLDKGLLLVESTGVTKHFDESGFLTRITDRNGNYAEVKRSSEGKIKSAETSFGEKYSFEYSGNFIRIITNERSPDENVIYSYSGNKLVSVKDTDGDAVTMDYDSEGRMTSLNKCDGSSVKFTYGEETADGKILTTATTNEEGYAEAFEYDRSGKRTDYIDHDGNRTSYLYDEKHRTVREVHPDGSDIKNIWDADGNLASVNVNGFLTEFTYDSAGNKTEASYNDGSRESWTYNKFNQVLSYNNRDGIYEEYIRDEKGNLCEYRKGGKVVFEQAYDSKGQIIRRIVYSQNPVITVYEYDSHGNMIKESCGGSATEYEYDSRNRVIKIRLCGKIVSEYNYEGHKAIQKNYNGLETTYITNGRKDLEEVIQKDTVSGVIHKIRIENDKRHLPLKVFAGDGESEKLITAYSYTLEGKLKSETFYEEENWTREYEYKNGQINIVKLHKNTSNEVFVQKYEHRIQNGNKNLFAVTDALGIKTLFEYDSYGNLIKSTDGNGEIIQKKYTKEGLLSAEQSSYGGWYEYGYKDGYVISAGEENGVTVKAEYYPDGSIKSISDRYGKITHYTYDQMGRINSIQSEVRKTWYEYDNFNRIIKQVVGPSYDENSAVYYVSYDYSEDGRYFSVTEGGKYKTVYELDAFGNATKQIDGNNNERSFVYDELNQLTEIYDGYNNKTSYKYNALGKISSIKLPEGAETKYSYNYMGLLEKVSDECGILYSASYDKTGRLIKERTRADSEKSYEYDRAGRVVKVLCGDEVIESYIYGTYGRTLTVKDGNGNDYLYNYDGFGRLASERNRNNLEQKYYYDADGKLKSKTDFSGGIVEVNYSADRSVRTVRYSDGSENRFVYDSLGNIIEAQNEYGKTLYRYDQGARLIYQKDTATGEEVYFEYDPAGNRKKLYSTNRETTYSYGKNNEVKEIFDNKQRVSIKLEYDKNGRELLRKFGNGTAEYTLYDRAGRVTVKMQKDERGKFLWGEGYSYASDGKRNATVDNSGRVTLYEYDSKGRLSSVYYPCTEEMTASLKKEAEENGLPCLNDAGENKYLPSEIRNQLIPLLNSMQYGLANNLPNLHIFIKESYSYDKNGNRTTKTTPYGTIEYSYDRENCLTSSGSRGQSFVNYTYDKMGNLLTEESVGKTVKYAYNSQNRLIYCEVIEQTNKEYSQTSYAYDAFGRRIIVQDKGEAALRTLYEGLSFDVIKQSPTLANGMFTDSYETGIRWGNTGRPTGDRYRYLGDDDAKDNNRYFYLDENTYKTANTRYRGERTTINVNGTIAAQTTADYGAEYFTTDLLGSVRSTSDTYGTAKSTYTYDAFGTLVQGSLNGTTDYGYLGKQHDSTSRLYNYGYRDYNPAAARFTTVDPIRDGHNWFAYCNGDPVNFVDLWGQAPRNLSAEDREAYMNKISEYKDYVNNSNEMEVPDDYDCADTMTYLYGQGTSVTSLGNQSGNLSHNGQKIGTNIKDIHSSDFFPSNTDNITFYSEKEFNNPNVEIGTVLVWEADPGSNWIGHTATVVDITRDSDGNVNNIKIIQGHTGGNKTEVVDIPNQNDLNSYRGTFHGFGELGQNSTIPFEKSSNY